MDSPQTQPKKYLTGPCTFPGCTNRINSHGLCMGHWYQQRDGKELTPLRPRRKPVDGKKQCADCGLLLPVSEFGINGQSVMHRCKACVSINNRMRNYGLTRDEVIALVAQDHCDVCKGEAIGRYKHIDHCHTTGKVRGVLCHSCNIILGHVGDDPAKLLALVAYLQRA